MAKSVKFKSNSEGPIRLVVSATGGIFNLEPGEEIEVEDPREIEALSANSDVSEVKAARKSNKGSK